MKTIFAILATTLATAEVSHAVEPCDSVAEFAGYAVKARFTGVTENAFLEFALDGDENPITEHLIRTLTSAVYALDTRDASPEKARVLTEMAVYSQCMESTQ